MDSKKLLTLSFVFSVGILLLTESTFHVLNRGAFSDLEGVLLAPLFFVVTSYLISSVILLFFSDHIFKRWLRQIVSWFLPVSIIVIWFGSGGNDFVSPDKTDLAIVMGYVLSIVTFVFALVQKFYYKR